MFGLPKSTEFNKKIPKQKFYENLTVSPALKRIFVEQINSIIWLNKISPATVNISPSDSITEIEIFKLKLNQKSLDEFVLKQIDKHIPYHIVFILEFEGNYKICIGYKELSGNNTKAYKVLRYFETKWHQLSELPLLLEGISMNEVFENFIRQISRNDIQKNTSVKEAIEIQEKQYLLIKQISKLQSLIRKEKQLNKQIQLRVTLKKIEQELEVLIND